MSQMHLSCYTHTAQRKGWLGQGGGAGVVQKATANCPKERQIRVSTKETWLKGAMQFSSLKILICIKELGQEEHKTIPRTKFFSLFVHVYLCTPSRTVKNRTICGTTSYKEDEVPLSII